MARQFDDGSAAADPYAERMLAYEELDAFKVCQDLALRTYREAERLNERDPELAAQLWSAALFAPARIARGAGLGKRRRFACCLDRTLGALSELGYHLKMARTLDLVPEESARELEGLRGRAVFYTSKLILDLTEDPDEAGEEP